MIDTATVTGRWMRDAAILKMTPDQIAEAKRRVLAFKPHASSRSELPEPGWMKEIKLTGLSGAAQRRLAIINGTTFSAGEAASIKVGARKVQVRCLKIGEKSARIEVEGVDTPRELFLSGG